MYMGKEENILKRPAFDDIIQIIGELVLYLRKK